MAKLVIIRGMTQSQLETTLETIQAAFPGCSVDIREIGHIDFVDAGELRFDMPDLSFNDSIELPKPLPEAIDQTFIDRFRRLPRNWPGYTQNYGPLRYWQMERPSDPDHTREYFGEPPPSQFIPLKYDEDPALSQQALNRINRQVSSYEAFYGGAPDGPLVSSGFVDGGAEDNVGVVVHDSIKMPGYSESEKRFSVGVNVQPQERDSPSIGDIVRVVDKDDVNHDREGPCIYNGEGFSTTDDPVVWFENESVRYRPWQIDQTGHQADPRQVDRITKDSRPIRDGRREYRDVIDVPEPPKEN